MIRVMEKDCDENVVSCLHFVNESHGKGLRREYGELDFIVRDCLRISKTKV